MIPKTFVVLTGIDRNNKLWLDREAIVLMERSSEHPDKGTKVTTSHPPIEFVVKETPQEIFSDYPYIDTRTFADAKEKE